MAQPPATFSRSRARVRFDTSVLLSMEEDIKLLFEHTFDVSMNGIFVRTARPLAMGAVAEFSLNLSMGMRKEEIQGACQVVRVVSIDDGLVEEKPGPGMALKILELAEESDHMLYQLIRHNSL